ncbi:MAG: Rrf2 family transcriptional regulator [Chloroflexota bacterium]|nr:Rrf2 family transcriptional regulator [Chloroflexota bacterium]
MRVSRQADYAIRVVLDLSLHPEARIKEIARRQRLSASYVGRISQRLAKTGILENKRGRLGCLGLACPPDQVTLMDVIEAVDGPVKVDRCLLAPAECGRERACPVYEVGQEVLLMATAKLSSVTFASLVNGQRAKQPTPDGPR